MNISDDFIDSIDLTHNFKLLGLSESVLHALDDAGYVEPTPIQSGVISVLMSGKDVIGQAQTGTGKTAAFALPILEMIDPNVKAVQALILTPTRELAIQVCESFKKYSTYIKGVKTLAVYGGQEYGIQLRGLLNGAQIVVGTPGRVMDHISRGTLKLDIIKCLVLDEADEMLNMGFKEDVEWVLERSPEKRQIALFSATMPRDIRELSKRFLNSPEEVTIRLRTATVETTRQRFWVVTGLHKIDALCRLLENEPYEAVLIFAARKIDTVELTEQLVDRGFAVAALNGDIAQNQRERIITQLKSGKINIVVATDVAARGLDVSRITHVINYDIPQDPESYVHRIGRTGRAGRNGEAIIFIAPREMRWLKMVERVTRQKIEEMSMPTADEINAKRIENFKNQITSAVSHTNFDFFKDLIALHCKETDTDTLSVAAAIASLRDKEKPLLLKERKKIERKPMPEFEPFELRNKPRTNRNNRDETESEEGMETYRIEVGKTHGVMPGNIVGAISGETGMASRYIGRIKMFDEFCLVDLPEGMPEESIEKLKTAWICRRQMNISMDKKSNKDRKAPSESARANTKKLCSTGYKTERPAHHRADSQPEGQNTKESERRPKVWRLSETEKGGQQTRTEKSRRYSNSPSNESDKKQKPGFYERVDRGRNNRPSASPASNTSEKYTGDTKYDKRDKDRPYKSNEDFGRDSYHDRDKKNDKSPMKSGKTDFAKQKPAPLPFPEKKDSKKPFIKQPKRAGSKPTSTGDSSRRQDSSGSSGSRRPGKDNRKRSGNSSPRRR